MKERPILFSSQMVRAILDGRKSQTRRVCKFQSSRITLVTQAGEEFLRNGQWHFWETRGQLLPTCTCKCPYGVPGDRLWVRETFGRFWGGWKYRATDDRSELADKNWHPSIHMPREASRITLEVADIRVERLQDISEEDAIAEGIELIEGDYNFDDFSGMWRDYTKSRPYWNSTIDSFHSLWDSISKPGYSWDDNPWIWVVEFRRAES